MINIRFLFFLLLGCQILQAQQVHFRTNIVGYQTEDAKVAFIMSDQAIKGKAALLDQQSGKVVFKTKIKQASGEKWGKLSHQYLFDFSTVQKAGTYYIQVGAYQSDVIQITQKPYADYHEDMIRFMQQQRSGYNPYFDVVCHQLDGRLFYGPVPDSTYYDFSGGWHDAADQLQYLITSSNATARMLLAYEMAPDLFHDEVDDYGRKGPNGLPDVLDEARWGLEWILKLHPKEDWLIHQIADDRDHRGFKFPDKDHADYGWGPNSYRPAYFANGKPQGLGKWKSKATGIANVAGRSAAALAIGARVWKQLGTDEAFVIRCEKAAHELYRMGKKKEGFQQGNSYGAPYRYNEDSWEDDMEWAAAELFRLSQDKTYLEDAIHYAYLIKDDGWMARDTMSHYQKYPFMNMGHFALYSIAPDTVKPQLAGWYRSNIEKVLKRSQTNAFQVGVPFLWCSSNLMVNFVTQVQLYERMTGDRQFHATMLLHRDWLFGRNPWGTSMFTGIPRNGETPLDVHLGPRALLGDTPPGGLIDGPIYRSIHNYLKGLNLNEPDEFAEFQNDFIVYHDDIGDYSTNEPTMDGTADSIFMMALLNTMHK